MKQKYIWQLKFWPRFTWDDSRIIRPLAQARKLQGKILASSSTLKLIESAEILLQETISSAAIEGEELDRNSVRSSIARRLGIPSAGISKVQRNVDGLVEVLLDATQNHTSALTKERLCRWQSALFPTGHSGLIKIVTGAWRRGEEPMQVVSGSFGKTVVHFEAPPSHHVATEMKAFIKWFKGHNDIDGILRAAITHLWFVTIHPFDDGNGRLARALTDMALAQDEQQKMRLYSLSQQIESERKAYYEILESTQKGNGDITDWLIWFLEMYSRSLERSFVQIEKSFWLSDLLDRHPDLNERQKKVIRKLAEFLPGEFVGGLTNKKYVSMTKVSPETAKRDMKDLVERKILVLGEAKGRSTNYQLAR